MNEKFEDRPIGSQTPDLSGAKFGVIVAESETLSVRLASAAAIEFLGYEPEGIEALSLRDLAPDLPNEEWMECDETARRLRTRLVTRQGREVPVQLTISVLKGRGQACLHVAMEPDAKAGRQELGDALLRSVIDTAPDAIITISGDGIVDGFSPAAQRMFGYSADEVIGRNVSMLMPEPHRAQHDGYLARYLETGEKRVIGIGRTVSARHKTGRVFPIELAVGEVKNGDDRIFTGFIRDITERQASQARAIRLQQELNHVARLSAMGEITSMIVHELNQPLTAVANFGEAARRLVASGDDAKRAAEFLAKAVQQTHRASDIIRRLRGFVSAGSGEMEPIRLNDVVRDAARLALIGAADQGVRARFDLAPGLPTVVADRVQVQQVVVNLILNAIDAMVDARVPAPHLVVSTGRREDGDFVISVTDNGPGLAEAIAGDLFTPFRSTKKDGMGIGLSVSRAIVEAHRGRIWHEPGEGGGARFSFTLAAASAR